MNFLRDAMAAVQRNLGVTLVYAGIFGGLGLLFYGVDHLVIGTPNPEHHPPLAVQGYVLAKVLAITAIQAIVQAIVFARMGKEIDKPLWRNDDDWTAVRRFFNVWFTLGLVEVAMFQFVSTAHGAGSGSAALFFVLFVFVMLVKIQVGACIMFSGALDWGGLGKDLAPLWTFLPRMFLLILLNLVYLTLMPLGEGSTQEWTRLVLTPALNIIGSYIECVIFAGTWIMCIEYRSISDDPDFDF